MTLIERFANGVAQRSNPSDKAKHCIQYQLVHEMRTGDTTLTESPGSSQPDDGASTDEFQLECLWLTPPTIAKRLGVKVDKVRAWILAGELRASNFAEKLSGRARYRVHITALIAFEKHREVKPPSATVHRRRKQPDDVIEFF